MFDRKDSAIRWNGVATPDKCRFRTGLLLLALGAVAVGCEENQPDPRTENANSFAGDFYQEILEDSIYPKLMIEIDVMEGAFPTEDAQNVFNDAKETLREYIDLLCYKPGGIEFLPLGVIPAPDNQTEFTLDEVKALEDEHRETYWHDDSMALYFMYLTGHSDYDTEDTSVVGYAYRGSSMAIFMDTVMARPPVARTPLLKTVTVHEFGHQIGLVDNGAPMKVAHDDSQNPPHCDNPDCMMYWLNNGTSSLMDLLTGEIPDFDDNCLDDIVLAGGRNAVGIEQPN